MLQDQLQDDLVTALKARDEITLSTLRMLMAAIKQASVAGKEARTLSDAEVEKVIAKEVKKRQDAIEAYSAAGRPERAAAEEAERQVLQRYLPEPLSGEELERIVKETLAENDFTSPAHMGPAMKAIQAKVAGRADGKALSALVRSLLA